VSSRALDCPRAPAHLLSNRKNIKDIASITPEENLKGYYESKFIGRTTNNGERPVVEDKVKEYLGNNYKKWLIIGEVKETKDFNMEQFKKIFAELGVEVKQFREEIIAGMLNSNQRKTRYVEVLRCSHPRKHKSLQTIIT
jgi:hypothetical protein